MEIRKKNDYDNQHRKDMNKPIARKS